MGVGAVQRADRLHASSGLPRTLCGADGRYRLSRYAAAFLSLLTTSMVTLTTLIRAQPAEWLSGCHCFAAISVYRIEPGQVVSNALDSFQRSCWNVVFRRDCFWLAHCGCAALSSGEYLDAGLPAVTRLLHRKTTSRWSCCCCSRCCC